MLECCSFDAGRRHGAGVRAAGGAQELAPTTPARPTRRRPRRRAPDAAAHRRGLLDDDELDALVAPIALYPDRAADADLRGRDLPARPRQGRPLRRRQPRRCPTGTAPTGGEARTGTRACRCWPAGFPTVVQRMAANIDWTEDLGDADAGADRRRARRRAAHARPGSGDRVPRKQRSPGRRDDGRRTRSPIAPTDPEVVYVPSYDSTDGLHQRRRPRSPATVVTDTGMTDTGDLLTTGAIAFGSALLVNEIFDDDDDDWDNYWRGPALDRLGRRRIPSRPGGDIDGGDVDIDVDRTAWSSIATAPTRRPAPGDRSTPTRSARRRAHQARRQGDERRCRPGAREARGASRRTTPRAKIEAAGRATAAAVGAGAGVGAGAARATARRIRPRAESASGAPRKASIDTAAQPEAPRRSRRRSRKATARRVATKARALRPTAMPRRCRSRSRRKAAAAQDRRRSRRPSRSPRAAAARRREREPRRASAAKRRRRRWRQTQRHDGPVHAANLHAATAALLLLGAARRALATRRLSTAPRRPSTR